MTKGQRRRALQQFVEETQLREWDHLMAGIRRAITRPNSIEVMGRLDVIREAIALVGPSDWNAVPWAVYISGLYAFVIGDEHKDALPTPAEYTEAYRIMTKHTNLADVDRCRELVKILKEARDGA